MIQILEYCLKIKSSYGFIVRTFWFVILVLLFHSNVGFAQVNGKPIEIVQAGSLEGVKYNGIEVRRLVGNVIFRQENTLLYCDSALFYEYNNTIDAYGQIRMEGPQARLTGEVIHYDGNTKNAQVSGKQVHLTDGKMDLTTTILFYDLLNDVGSYFQSGQVKDKENTLTSEIGYYYARNKEVFFKNKVRLVNPRYVMNSDTLKYNTINNTAYFFGPTTINGVSKDGGFIYCENGWYNTQTEKSMFGKNAYIHSKENKLMGDSLFYNRIEGVGKAWKNVSLTDTIQKIIVAGEYAYMNEIKGKSFVTGKSSLIKIFEKDSMYLHADTLYVQLDSAKKQKQYFAYHKVKIFKNDLQGSCDSLVYNTSDSLISFYSNPILWSDKNQLTANFIKLKLSNNQLNKLYLEENSFIVGQEDSLRYNQIKGRNMVGYFYDNKLGLIKVAGNGQTVYFIRNKKQQLTGVNKADCSDMNIYISDSKVKKIALKTEPDAVMMPVKDAIENDIKLRDFKWLDAIRPKRKEDIF
ncbi:MAG: OstA-like protein [Bacteroidota bacterium]